MDDTRHLQRDVGRTALHFVGALKRRPRRELRRDDEITAVLLRDETRRCTAEYKAAGDEHTGINHQHDDDHAHHTRRQLAVTPDDDIEATIEQPEKSVDRRLPPAFLVRRIVALEQQGAQGRRQRQRCDQRHHRRACDGQRELSVELP